MLKNTLIFSLSAFSLFALPVQNASIEDLEEQLEMDDHQECFFSEDEEITLLHKKGSRPQVIEVPTKTSLSP
jgi:hypothetical protein